MITFIEYGARPTIPAKLQCQNLNSFLRPLQPSPKREAAPGEFESLLTTPSTTAPKHELPLTATTGAKRTSTATAEELGEWIASALEWVPTRPTLACHGIVGILAGVEFRLQLRVLQDLISFVDGRHLLLCRRPRLGTCHLVRVELLAELPIRSSYLFVGGVTAES